MSMLTAPVHTRLAYLTILVASLTVLLQLLALQRLTTYTSGEVLASITTPQTPVAITASVGQSGAGSGSSSSGSSGSSGGSDTDEPAGGTLVDPTPAAGPIASPASQPAPAAAPVVPATGEEAVASPTAEPAAPASPPIDESSQLTEASGGPLQNLFQAAQNTIARLIADEEPLTLVLLSTVALATVAILFLLAQLALGLLVAPVR